MADEQEVRQRIVRLIGDHPLINLDMATQNIWQRVGPDVRARADGAEVTENLWCEIKAFCEVFDEEDEGQVRRPASSTTSTI